MESAHEPDELLTEIRWPLAAGEAGFVFEEIARRHGDYALCGVAVWARTNGPVRIGLLGVAATPEIHDVRGRLEQGMST